MESAAASPENPVIARALSILKERAEFRKCAKERRKIQREGDRLAEKWKAAIAADPEMKQFTFGLWVRSELYDQGVWMPYRDTEDLPPDTMSKKQLIEKAVADGLINPAWYLAKNGSESKLWQRGEKCRQFARRIGRRIIPGERAVANLFKLTGRKADSPAQYIQWLKEAWEYEYPPDKD